IPEPAAARAPPVDLCRIGSVCPCLCCRSLALVDAVRPARRRQKPRRPAGARPPGWLDQRPGHALGHLSASLRLPPYALGPGRHRRPLRRPQRHPAFESLVPDRAGEDPRLAYADADPGTARRAAAVYHLQPRGPDRQRLEDAQCRRGRSGRPRPCPVLRADGLGSASSGRELVLGPGDFRLRCLTLALDRAAFPAHLWPGLGAEAGGLGLEESGAEPVLEWSCLIGGPAPGRSVLPQRGGAGAGFHRSRRRLPGYLL